MAMGLSLSPTVTFTVPLDECKKGDGFRGFAPFDLFFKWLICFPA
jgi:hypothetical protein